jgi:hypothetical protein
MKIVYDSEADKRHRMVLDGDGGKLNVVAFKLEMVFENGQSVTLTKPSGGFTMKTINKIVVAWNKEFPDFEAPK